MWSPDGETIAHVVRSRTGGTGGSTLLLTCVSNGVQRAVSPLADPILVSCTFWSPNSQLLVSVAHAHVNFVDRQTCTARLQFVSTGLSSSLGPVHRAMCSKAGLVILAQIRQARGMLHICSFVGKPRKLQVLQQLETERAAISLAFLPNGLLLAWADCYSHHRPDRGILFQGRPCVQVCELATGRFATLSRRPQVRFDWLGFPFTEAWGAHIMGHRAAPGLRISWASSGTVLCICGPPAWKNEAAATMPVQRVRLLP